MKIIKFYAENIKRLKCVEIKPDGAVIRITGPNGSGKSSVLDAIAWALTGTRGITSKPVRTGEKHAVIKLDLGELKVTRNFDANGTTTLLVESAKGVPFASPQAMLDKLMGSLSFDPLAFTRMKPKEQLDSLKALVKLDVDLDALDARNKELFDERTVVNREAKSLQAQYEGIRIADDLPNAKLDITELNAKLRELSESESTKAGLVRQQGEIGRSIDRIDKQIEDLLAEQTKLTRQNDVISRRIKDIPRFEYTADSIREQIEESSAINSQLEDLNRRVMLKRQSDRKSSEADSLTEQINNNNAVKAEAIQSAKMPVKGLGFGEGMVMFNDLPFDQASSAEQLRVSTALAMAANPRLRVLRIKEGSLLDKKSYALLEKMAEAGDYQTWVECVETDSPVGIVMSNGEVVK